MEIVIERPGSAKPEAEVSGHTWRLKNYNNDDLLELLPEVKDDLVPPKQPRSAYHFFDKVQRPKLDNDQLFLASRLDPARPKLATMQMRAIDELWEFSTSDERCATAVPGG